MCPPAKTSRAAHEKPLRTASGHWQAVINRRNGLLKILYPACLREAGASLRRRQAVSLMLAVIRDLREGNLRLRAAGLTYTTLLSLAPLLAICFAVLKGVGMHNQLEPFLLDFLEPLGEPGHDIAGRIVGFVDNIK